MFLIRDIHKLTKLIDPDVNIRDHLDESELNAIGNYISNVRESIFIPKHSRPLQTLILKKICTNPFNLSDFILNVGKSITGTYEIRIAMSFIVSKSMDQSKLEYIFGIHHRIINDKNRIIRDKEDMKNLVGKLEAMSKHDLLFKAFERFLDSPSIQHNPTSGWTPKRLVLSVIWLTKINGKF